MQTQTVMAASVRGRAFPLLRQTHSMLPRCGASGSTTAARTSGPCAKESCRTPILNKQSRVELPKCKPGRRRSFRRVQKPWSFRLCDDLPRGVAVLGDRRSMLSCIFTPARRIPRRPSNLTCVVCAAFKKKTSSSPHLVHYHQHYSKSSPRQGGLREFIMFLELR